MTAKYLSLSYAKRVDCKQNLVLPRITTEVELSQLHYKQSRVQPSRLQSKPSPTELIWRSAECHRVIQAQPSRFRRSRVICSSTSRVMCKLSKQPSGLQAQPTSAEWFESSAEGFESSANLSLVACKLSQLPPIDYLQSQPNGLQSLADLSRVACKLCRVACKLS